MPFLMPVEDVFTISGIGTVATGTVERGTVNTNDAIEVIGAKPAKATTARLITERGQPLSSAKPGDKIGIVLRGVEKTDVEHGNVIAKAGSVKSAKKFKATLDLAATADGGRAKAVTDQFRPLFNIRTGGFSGVITLPAGKKEIAPGTKATVVTIEMSDTVPLEKGLKFTIKEFGKTIGSGVVTEVIQ